MDTPMPTNRKQRRTSDAMSRSRKPTPKFLSKDWAEKKKAISKRVENNLAKVKARKIKRLADTVINKEEKKIKKIKITVAEQKQIRRKIKALKFKSKFGL